MCKEMFSLRTYWVILIFLLIYKEQCEKLDWETFSISVNVTLEI